MRQIDLSHNIHSGMPTFPVAWHPYVEVTQLGRHGIEQRETHRIMLGTHTGTHVDAPSHFISGGGTIDAIPLELLYGPAQLLDMGPPKDKEVFDISFFEKHLAAGVQKRLILRFNWSQQWGTLKYFTSNPYLTEQAAQWLIDHGVRMLGMDVPQIDSPDHGRGCSKDSPNHKIMLGQGCYFVENLTNLHKIKAVNFDWIVAPLNILGVDGAPCRSIALEK